MTDVRLSVIITVVDGAAAVRRCLAALQAQREPPEFEILVPFDRTVADVAALRDEFPDVRFPELELTETESRPQNEYERHELFDRRRAVGLRAASGQLLAMLEDRGLPAPDWARAMDEVLDDPGIAGVGGVIENGASEARLWAVFFTDFGRYQPPVEDPRPEYLSDINICYRRATLDSVRDLWEERYQEAKVNWALRERGFDLVLSERPKVVQHRAPVPLSVMLRERYHWARVFAHTRGAQNSTLSNLAYAFATPLLPPLLWLRHLRRQLRKQHHVGAYFRATPALWLFLVVWAWGEFVGYLQATFAPKGKAGQLPIQR